MPRGRLRIYLGSAPGVGKTVAMLSEGHRRAKRGTDVVIGLVETHGRAFTSELAEGLEQVPRQTIDYRGTHFTELDLEAVLRRDPEVALIDELAHTNIPGSRHTKRWEDIAALLEAGIDVVSTVNIQHLESLNDAVESITGVRQRETVPDEVVRAADQVELVDMSPEALRRRMAHGNIYTADKIDAAISSYFRVGNLSALRELALLWVADRVDEALERYREHEGISDSWPTRERIVAAVTGGPESEVLLRRAARIASRGAGGELLAVHVARADGLSGTEPGALHALHDLTDELGGTFQMVRGASTAEAVLGFAKGINATQIVIGVSRRPAWRNLWSPGSGDAIVRGSGDIDVHIVTHGQVAPRREPGPGRSVGVRRRVVGWLMATAGLAILTALLLATDRWHDLPLELLLFMAWAVACSLVGGWGPGVVSAVLGSASLNYWFTPPRHTFTIENPQNAAALLTFVVVAGAVSSAVHLSERRARVAVAAQQESDALAGLAQSLLGASDRLPLLLRDAMATFGASGAAILTRTGDHDPWVVAAAEGERRDLAGHPDESLTTVDTNTRLALAGVVPSGSDQRLLTAYASHAASVLARERLTKEARRASSLARENEARRTLLTAVSHDLRTPLAAIKAAVTSLRQNDVVFSLQDQAELLATIEHGADRLALLIANLLDLSRLQLGAVTAHRDEVSVTEVVTDVVTSLDEDHRVSVIAVPAVPTALADAGLLDRVLANVIENSVRHAPGDSPITVGVSSIEARVEVRVSDRGPGVDDAAKERMFEAFQRVGDVPRGSGVGLGLAVARGFTEAMDGEITVEDTPGGGLTVVVSLPTAASSKVAS